MYATLIPFFLAANVIVNDTSNWTFGPEYTYDLNYTYSMKLKSYESPQGIQMISTMKCRPKAMDNLFCHLNNFTAMERSANINVKELETETMFEIKFNEHGVEGLVIETPIHLHVVNVLRKTATQFNVIVDPAKIDMLQFMARENTSMGNCATMYSITQEKPELEEHVDRDTDFHLIILPLANVKPETILSIEKTRVECTNASQFNDLVEGTIEMGKFVSKIRIGFKEFKIFTEFNEKLIRATETVSFKELIQINLKSIDPAQGELPTLTYGEQIDLNTKNKIPSNFTN